MPPSPLSPGAADALLFDLGRVVLDIDFSRAIRCWAAHAGCEPSEILARYVRDDSYRHHETGRISDADYFESLRASLGISITDAQFLEGWNAIFAGEMPGIAELLERAANHLPLYAFSNTNRPHVEHFSQAHADVLGHFREIYLSSTIGLRNRIRRPMITSSARSGFQPRASCSLTTSPRILRARVLAACWPFM